MTSPPKLALELVLGWLEAAKPPLLEPDPDKGPCNDFHASTKNARGHLQSAAALQAACKLDRPVKNYSAVCWSRLLAKYEQIVVDALKEFNCDHDWGTSELKRIKVLRRKGPGIAGPSFQKAIGAYPTEASRIFVLGGGPAGAWQHVSIMRLVHLAQEGHMSAFDPLLNSGVDIECERVQTVRRMLALCPGLRTHDAAKRLMDGDLTTLWVAAMPHYWANLVQQRRGRPRPFSDYCVKPKLSTL